MALYGMLFSRNEAAHQSSKKAVKYAGKKETIDDQKNLPLLLDGDKTSKGNVLALYRFNLRIRVLSFLC